MATLRNLVVGSLHLIVISLNLFVTFPDLVEISLYLVGCRYICEKWQYQRTRTETWRQFRLDWLKVNCIKVEAPFNWSNWFLDLKTYHPIDWSDQLVSSSARLELDTIVGSKSWIHYVWLWVYKDMYISYKFCPFKINPTFAFILIGINVYVNTIKLIWLVEFFI